MTSPKTYLDYKIEQTSIYRTDFDEGYVVWTPLPWSEYRKYREARELVGGVIDIQLEESIFNKCVLHSSLDEPPPEDLPEEEQVRWIEDSRGHLPAGIVSTVVKNILSVSGTIDSQSIIEYIALNRQIINNIEDQLVTFICSAFPAYTPEQVEDLEWATILKRAAQAETILGTQIEIYDPEEEERKAVEAQKVNIQKEISDMEKFMKPNQKTVQKEIEEEGRRFRKERAELRRQYLKERGMG